MMTKGIALRRITMAALLLTGTTAFTGSAAAQTIAITGGRVFPVSGPAIENGTVLIRDGRIAAVGANVTIPENATRIDASGRWVTPGLINSATALGVVEIGAVSQTRDVAARSENRISAAFPVWEALNPASVLLAPARSEGVTSVVVAPSGGLIAGQAAFVDLVEGAVPDLVVRAPIAMVGQMGNTQAAGVESRGELLVRLRELLEDTRVYARRRADFERNATRDFSASRLDLEAMIPVLEGTLPLVLSVHRASDIQAALRLAREYGLRLIIAGGAEAWMVADQLAAARVPVLTQGLENIPQDFNALGQRQENAGLLRSAAVDVAIIGGSGESFNVRNVRQEAGNAVAYGMSWDDALAAVTLTPARIFGVGASHGSLEAGKVANVVVWSGDPFEFLTRAEHVIVRGRLTEQESRQDELMQRYLSLPPDYRN